MILAMITAITHQPHAPGPQDQILPFDFQTFGFFESHGIIHSFMYSITHPGQTGEQIANEETVLCLLDVTIVVQI